MKKVKRSIIQIDDDKCTGCGACIPSCPEGALQVVDTPKGPKARLVREDFCDGLGACLGDCPEDALKVIESEVDEYDEDGVIKHIQKTAPEKLDRHLKHLKEHGMEVPDIPREASGCSGGCPGSKAAFWGEEKLADPEAATSTPVQSALRQWPIQLNLVNVSAPYFQDADVVIAADCVPFSYPNFHQEFLKGNSLIIGCPKLDDTDHYLDKLTDLFSQASVKSVTVVHMEVPCCHGLTRLVQEAISRSGKRIPYVATEISIRGEIKK